MPSKDFFKNLAEKITAAMPKNFSTMKQDLEKNLQSALSIAFTKLDIITREEFDVQMKVLERTRQKVDELEQKIAALEQKQ